VFVGATKLLHGLMRLVSREVYDAERNPRLPKRRRDDGVRRDLFIILNQ
jgi:hypothetical protein